MDVQFLNPVLSALVDVLMTMAEMEVKPGRPRVKKHNEAVDTNSVTGLMNIAGTDAAASIAITFPESVALAIAQKIMRQEKTKLDGMVIDMVGELANMVMGGARQQMEEKGYRFEMSLPTVIIGNDYLIAHRTQAPILQVPFKTASGLFSIEASFEKRPVS